MESEIRITKEQGETADALSEQIAVYRGFPKMSQYLAGLTAQQDPWAELARAIVVFFGADFVAFGERDSESRVLLHHWTPADSEPDDETGVRTLEAQICDVLNSGFLAVQSTQAPESRTVLFLPLSHRNQTIAVMAVGHYRTSPLAHERMNAYLSVAGLAGSMLARLRAEKALLEAREQLENRVRVRTAELAAANRSLMEEIIERKRTEEALKLAKEKAESATRSKSEFLAGMSHEIRTPMNSIIGFADLALMTDLNEKQRFYLNTIKDSSRILLSIVNDILDFSRIEARRLDLESAEFKLPGVLDSLAALLRNTASKKGLDLVISVDDAVPERLIGDSSRLGQVLINLTNNAIKFTEQGQITVTVDLEHRRADRIVLRFSVTDTGIGICPQEIPRLFAPFTQGDGSTTRKHGGTGLGLAISSHLVRLMGGEIGAESVPGRGSTFYFTAWFGIPRGEAVPEPEGQAGVPDALFEALRGARISLVEDNRINQQATLEHLERPGIKAHSPGQPDIRILPKCLPGIDLEAGVKMVMGNRGLFRKLLREFHQDYHNSTAVLRRALEKGDREAAGRLVHTLKGVSANIGARDLHEAATALDQVLKNAGGNVLQGGVDRFEHALDQVLWSIGQLDEKAALQPVFDRGLSVSSPETVEPIMARLASLLLDGESEAVRYLDSIKGLLSACVDRDADRERIRRLEQQTNHYEYEAALRTLQALAASVKVRSIEE